MVHAGVGRPDCVGTKTRQQGRRQAERLCLFQDTLLGLHARLPPPFRPRAKQNPLGALWKILTIQDRGRQLMENKYFIIIFRSTNFVLRKEES